MPAKNSDQAWICEIRIKGHLGHQWSDWFGGMTSTQAYNGDSLLTGRVMDQAALHGLLKKVRVLGMVLDSVIRLTPHPAEGYRSKR